MKKEVVNKIIESLNSEPHKWEFDAYTVEHSESNISLWITNIPLFDISIYKPVKISVSLIHKFRLYRAINKCKNIKVLSLLESEKLNK